MFASHVLMVRPRNFKSNPQTVLDNHFQKPAAGIDPTLAQELAETEFDRFVALLQDVGIAVTVIHQEDELDTPDAIFPNNWFSTHHDGTLTLYPMKAENRRAERRTSIIDKLQQAYTNLFDLREYEQHDSFLEGTGSMIIDHVHKNVFAAISERTHSELVTRWCDSMGYRPIVFSAIDREGQIIYHTNVMLHTGNGFAVIATSSIVDGTERAAVINALRSSDYELIDLSPDQVNEFAGNGLQLKNKNGEYIYVLSKRGWESLSDNQRERIKSRTHVITPDLSTIERLGGGSARCMMAELFDQK